MDESQTAPLLTLEDFYGQDEVRLMAELGMRMAADYKMMGFDEPSYETRYTKKEVEERTRTDQPATMRSAEIANLLAEKIERQCVQGGMDEGVPVYAGFDKSKAVELIIDAIASQSAPRRLIDLINEGYSQFWVWCNRSVLEDPKDWHQFSDTHISLPSYFDCPAIPIVKPEPLQ